MAKQRDNKYRIQAVERALTILQCFHAERLEMSMMEIAGILELNKSTTFRMVSTLCDMGFLEKLANGKYALGTEIIRLGHLVSEDMTLLRAAQPIMDELFHHCGETVAICRYSNGQMICIGRVESQKPLKCVCTVGADVPVLLGGTGRSAAAFLSDSELSRCIETQKRIGNPVCGKEELRAVVKRTRSNGYYISHSELDDAINALGLPIFGKNGVVLGSLSIVAPSSRMSDEVTWELLPEARRSAQRISERMGYDGNMLNSKGE